LVTEPELPEGPSTKESAHATAFLLILPRPPTVLTPEELAWRWLERPSLECLRVEMLERLMAGWMECTPWEQPHKRGEWFQSCMVRMVGAHPDEEQRNLVRTSYLNWKRCYELDDARVQEMFPYVSHEQNHARVCQCIRDYLSLQRPFLTVEDAEVHV
jgi:hypothetical protein